MSIIKQKDADILRKEFAEKLVEPVRLVMFTQEIECQYCHETHQLVEEVAALSDKIEVEVYNFITDAEKAKEYGVDKIPAIAILGDRDYGVRYYGIPSGYEFTSIVEDIISVSERDSGLAAETREAIAQLTEPVHIQVFVTPTCPYCPGAVRLAHQMAIESDLICADMVEAIEFPHLAHKYDVYGVPRSVINETVHIEGAVSEPMFLEKVLEAVE
jgi:glutaredoxin-like protein